MDKDVFEGKWKELRSQIKGVWSKLTDEELDKVGGSADQLIGLIQQKYGYTREYAEDEFSWRLREAEPNHEENK